MIMRLFFLVLFILGLCACGPSRIELEKAQKAREDSIRNSVVEKFATIAALKDSIKSAEAAFESNKSLLVIRRADLVASQDKLSRIRQPQFLRTPEEREQQIRNQMIVVQTLENEVRDLAVKIDHSEIDIKNLKQKLSQLQ